MADFTTSNAGGPMGTNVTPNQGVASNTGNILLSAIGSTVQGAFSAFEDAKKLEAVKTEKAEELAGSKVLSSFRSKQLQFVDAYEQGKMTQSEARTRMRAELNKFQANNPLLGEDILATHAQLMTTAGLGKVVDEGTAQDRERARTRQAALDAGFLEGAPDEEEAVSNYLRFKSAGETLAREQAQLTFENGKLERAGKLTSNETALISLQEKKIQLAQQAAVAEMADAFAPSVRDKTQSIVAKFRDGQLDVKGAVAELNAIRQTINTTVTGAGRKAGSEYLSTVVQPMIETLDIAKEVVTGNLESTALTNQLNSALTRQKLIQLSDPQNLNVVATSELFRNIDTLRAAEVDATVTRMLSTTLDNDTDHFNPFTKDAGKAKVALDVVRDSAAKSVGGKANPLLLEELDKSITDILSGVSAYRSSLTDTSQLKNIQDFLSDPVIASHIKSRGGIPKEVVGNAKEVVQELYEMRVLPAIKTQLQQSNVVSGFKSTGQGMMGGEITTTPAEDVVNIKFAGSDVYFEANSNIGKAKAKDLNKKLAPIMNKMIRVTAHLSGTTDYKSSFEQLFGSMVKEEPKGVEGNP